MPIQSMVLLRDKSLARQTGFCRAASTLTPFRKGRGREYCILYSLGPGGLKCGPSIAFSGKFQDEELAMALSLKRVYVESLCKNFLKFGHSKLLKLLMHKNHVHSLLPPEKIEKK
jgi:hypothetical protein